MADPGFLKGANSKSGCEKLLFGQCFPENCMKMKEIGPRGGARPWCPPLDPPMLSEPWNYSCVTITMDCHCQVTSMHQYLTLQTSLFNYCPPMKLQEGNVFSHICHSVHWGPMWSLLMIYWNSPYRVPTLSPLTGTPWPSGHVQTYSTWTSLYRTRPGHVQIC